jgi:hypothetical protein
MCGPVAVVEGHASPYAPRWRVRCEAVVRWRPRRPWHARRPVAVNGVELKLDHLHRVLPSVSAKGIKMKLADIDVDEVIRALGKERSKWIDVATKEKRQTTDAERTTICLLAALENVFSNMSSH